MEVKNQPANFTKLVDFLEKYGIKAIPRISIFEKDKFKIYRKCMHMPLGVLF